MIDLLAVAAVLEQRDPQSRLAAALRNAGRVQSCVADVRLARSTLEALSQLRKLGEWAPSIPKLAAEHAMVANAVFLYARAAATGAKAGERGHTSIRQRFEPELKSKHDRVVAIRNSALAHVRPNEAITDELWHTEIIFAVEQPNGAWLPAAMTRRVQSNPRLEAELSELLAAAEPLLREMYIKRIDYAAKELSTAAHSLPLNLPVLLDPVAVFGSEAEALQALTGHRPGGRTSGVIDR
jgi:hypothetical protein